MQKSYPFTFRKGDWFAIAAVLLLTTSSLLAFFPRSDIDQTAVVQIRLDGSVVQELPIDVDCETTISGRYENVISIRSGKVSITKSNCPGEDCVHSGWITSPGRSIVCLPNRVEIRITGASSDVDFIVR